MHRKYINTDVRDLIPSQVPCQERVNGLFVRCAEPGRTRPTEAASLVGDVETAERRAVRRLEVELRQRRPVDPPEGRPDPVWEAERVADRQAHVGQAELGDGRAVGEL